MTVLFKIIRIVLFSSALILAMDFANRIFDDADTINPCKVEFRAATHLEEGLSDLDENGWEQHLPDSPGLGWVKASFIWGEDSKAVYGERKRELIVSFLGAYELYWDGILIGHNGRVAERPEHEIAGYLDQKFILPDSLPDKESHVLFLRYSDHKNLLRNQIASFFIEPYNEYFKRSVVQAVLIYALAGIFLIVAVYYFFLYFNSFKNPSFILFALLCTVSFLLIMYAYSRIYYPYSYPDYPAMQMIISVLSWSITLLLPVFYLYHFQIPYRKPILFGIAVSLFVTRLLPPDLEWIYTTVAIFIPVGLVIWALIKDKLGGTEAMIGLIVFISGYMYFNISVYVGFSILVIATLFSLSVSLGIERKKQKAFISRSIRLESQLLKKNIQPHFLMNTLTNIISLIESDPKLSIRLIEALSAEFYSMMDIADKKLIPIEKEIELCKAHLQVMSIRNDIQYEMNSEQVSKGLKIPPAVLHTLIENGITHNRPLNGKITFDLSEGMEKGKKIIILKTFGAAKKAYSRIKDGIGIKYVKNRLEESFPDQWELYEAPTVFGWESKIIIKG